MDLTIISKAGLTQSQFAELVGVSRVTVNTWSQGRFRPQQRIRPRVIRALKLLEAAVENGTLPVKEDPDAPIKARLEEIASQLRGE